MGLGPDEATWRSSGPIWRAGFRAAPVIGPTRMITP